MYSSFKLFFNNAVGFTLYKNKISTLFYFYILEEVVEFVRKLSDVEVKEIPSTVTFECELSKPDMVAKWFRDGKPLGESDKYQMVVDGTVHKLVITDVDGEDEGDYSIVARGKKSEGELIVEGNFSLDKQYMFLDLSINLWTHSVEISVTN